MGEEMRTTQDDEYIICPNCGEQMGDCWEWVKAESAQVECDYCNKPMEVWAEHFTTYHARTQAQSSTSTKGEDSRG